MSFSVKWWIRIDAEEGVRRREERKSCAARAANEVKHAQCEVK